jgi:hypothetical protein
MPWKVSCWPATRAWASRPRTRPRNPIANRKARPGCFALLDVALAAPRRGPGSFLLAFDGRRVGEQPAWAECLVLMR